MPLIHLLALSFSDRAAATGGLVTLWPVRPTAITYEKVLAAGVFINAFWISVMRTVFGTTLQMTLVVLISFPLSKSKEEMPFRNFIMGAVVFAYLFNGGLIPWFWSSANWACSFAVGADHPAGVAAVERDSDDELLPPRAQGA